jgi:hypothetical protein
MMTESTDSSVPETVNAAPGSKVQPPGKGRKPWMMIVAIVVAVLLIATAVIVVFPQILGGNLTATISGDPSLSVDAGTTTSFFVIAKLGNSNVTNETGIKFTWSVTPASLGSFTFKARSVAPFVSNLVGGSGSISCTVSYKGQNVTVKKDMTVLPPYLDSVSVSPPTKTILPGSSYNFTASAVSSVGVALSDIPFNWTATATSGVTYTFNTTSGPAVMLSVDSSSAFGNITLNVSGYYGGMTKWGISDVIVGNPPPRSVDYVWYDMFNVPMGPWYNKRWDVYHQEEPISTSYPYLFYYHSTPLGNVYTYTLMRLNITGRNVSEINMNTRPEFLPILSPTERGGTAVISWYMQYLTQDELSTRYGAGIASQDDGWIIDLNGTVLLDKQAAKTVMGLTNVGWDDFSTWWANNGGTFQQNYGDWLVNEAEHRVDIENAYESYFQLFTASVVGTKIGDHILLKYDILTWGMEALMLRWLHECLIPIEMWYEDMHFNMTIGPEYSKVDIDTAVTYSLYATESHNITAPATRGNPCWAFEPLLGDAVVSSVQHPISELDRYADLSYTNMEVGAQLYDQNMSYDVVPASWNLSANETLTFEWPQGNQLFRYGVKPGVAVNVTDDVMVVNYAEPMWTDFPDNVFVDNVHNTLKYVGPIDLWDWSKNQTNYSYMQQGWNDTSGLLPYGVPWVEFVKKNPVVLHLDHFDVNVSEPSLPLGDIESITVTAIDQYGNTYYDYNGTVNFTSSDPLAMLPDNYTFNSTDQGTHTFDASVQFNTSAATQTINVINISAAPQKSGSVTVQILPKRTAGSVQVEVYHMPMINVPEDVKVTVIDQYGDVFLNYTGTVTFSTNRSGEATMPADYQFVLADAGVHTIPASLTFTSAGNFTVYCNDSSDSAITGSQMNIWVLTTPETIDHFVVSGIGNMVSLQRSDVNVTAYNQYGIVFQRYNGTISFSYTSDRLNGTAVLPPDYTFEWSDNGFKTFVNGVRFTVGVDTIFTVTVTDVNVTTATGTQTGIQIFYRPSSEVFTMYDIMNVPWGEWWKWRYPAYGTDIILTNVTGKYTMIYNPDTRGQQGIIMAPYRWNINATNMSQVDINNPEFMPVLGTPNVANASASVDIFFQYLSNEWWNDYWDPYWHFPPDAMNAQRGDGYYPGVTYNITMNREAALEWLGMPLTADPVSWWNLNGGDYISAWEAWILNEGNNRLDIYSGYEWPYTDLGTKMKLSVLPGGDLYLEIGHLGEGYEILMTRWLSETGLCNHEPYYEDIHMNVKYYSNWINFNFDAACQYSLHAVLANQSSLAEGLGAWVWEPQLIDYVPSWSAGYHPSTFDPWALLTYQSHSAGDPEFGQQVGYDSGYTYFNLTDYQKFIIKLPQGNNVLGYYATDTVPFDAITRIILSGARGHPDPQYNMYPYGPDDNYNYTAYWPLMYNGTMSLGWVGNSSSNPDLQTMYNTTTNTITMVGPMNFDNTHHPNGALYRGAPWIEFNVTPVVTGTSVPVASSPAAVQVHTSAPAELVSVGAVVGIMAMAVVMLLAISRRRI